MNDVKEFGKVISKSVGVNAIVYVSTIAVIYGVGYVANKITKRVIEEVEIRKFRKELETI